MVPGSEFFKKMVFGVDQEVQEICLIEHAAPKEKKVMQKRSPAEALEALRKIGREGVEKEVSRLKKELRKGKWKGDTSTLLRILLNTLARWPAQQDVILQAVILLFKGELQDEVVSEVCRLIPQS